jgi:hypothetical protein
MFLLSSDPLGLCVSIDHESGGTGSESRDDSVWGTNEERRWLGESLLELKESSFFIEPKNSQESFHKRNCFPKDSKITIWDWILFYPIDDRNPQQHCIVVTE